MRWRTSAASTCSSTTPGICREERFLEITEESWDETIDVNLKGHLLVAQAVAREMVKAGSGAIVNMSSTNGLVGEAGYAAYNASKGGVLLLTKTMALELGPLGIRVNCVAPGYIVTPMSTALDSANRMFTYARDKIPLAAWPGRRKWRPSSRFWPPTMPRSSTARRS